MSLLLALAKRQGLEGKIASLFRGDEINPTEHRPVLHTVTRAAKGDGPIFVRAAAPPSPPDAAAAVAVAAVTTASAAVSGNGGGNSGGNSGGGSGCCGKVGSIRTAAAVPAGVAAGVAAPPSGCVDAVALVHAQQERIRAFADAVRAASGVLSPRQQQARGKAAGSPAAATAASFVLSPVGGAQQHPLDSDITDSSSSSSSSSSSGSSSGGGGGGGGDAQAQVILGYTGRPIKNIISVGIGGSYLGPSFVAEALATERQGIYLSQGFTLRFLSNVDPVDVER